MHLWLFFVRRAIRCIDDDFTHGLSIYRVREKTCKAACVIPGKPRRNVGLSGIWWPAYPLKVREALRSIRKAMVCITRQLTSRRLYLWLSSRVYKFNTYISYTPLHLFTFHLKQLSKAAEELGQCWGASKDVVKTPLDASWSKNTVSDVPQFSDIATILLEAVWSKFGDLSWVTRTFNASIMRANISSVKNVAWQCGTATLAPCHTYKSMLDSYSRINNTLTLTFWYFNSIISPLVMLRDAASNWRYGVDSRLASSSTCHTHAVLIGST